MATIQPGDRFGRWTVLRPAPRTDPNHSRWLCRCDCGTERSVLHSNLRHPDQRRASRSCGCLAREVARARQWHHGYAVHKERRPEYTAWQDMKGRCSRPKRRDFKHYGGRGVTVCPEWQESFEAFLRDVGPRPSGQHSLDRIDNDGNYEPGNVRWALRATQCANQRRGTRIEYNGRCQSVSEWALEIGIPAGTLGARLFKLGWSAERALTTPLH